jgi:uncharacterized protein YjbI with pentapeptide repeats
MRTRSRNWLYLRVCVAALLAGLVVGFVAESPATATPPPTTSVLVPANGATLSGTAAAVDATASNATSVEFWLLGGSYGFSGHLIGTATSTLYGWVYSWNTTTVPNGSYALLSEAIGAGGSGFSAGVPIKVSNPLATSVLVPATGATLSGTTATLDASASNATSVEFWILGGSYGYTGHLIGTATSTLYGWVYSWNTTTVPNGSYALLSEAIGAGGGGFSAAVSITITNAAVQNCDDWGPYADLQGCDLSDAELSDVNLSGANLNGANLNDAFLDGVTSGGITGTPSALPNSDWMLILGYLIGPYATLNDAKLTDANLTNADLEGATVNDANLTGANLTGATLNDAILTGATLTGANLTGATLNDANLSDADISGVIWSDTTCVNGTNSNNDDGTCANDL